MRLKTDNCKSHFWSQTKDGEDLEGLTPKSLLNDTREKWGLDRQQSSKQGFLVALKRLLSNKLFMYNFVSNVFYVFAFMGFGTFMPKFFELNFRIKRSSAAGTGGAIGTLPKGIGLLVSGKC